MSWARLGQAAGSLSSGHCITQATPVRGASARGRGIDPGLLPRDARCFVSKSLRYLRPSVTGPSRSGSQVQPQGAPAEFQSSGWLACEPTSGRGALRSVGGWAGPSGPRGWGGRGAAGLPPGLSGFPGGAGGGDPAAGPAQHRHFCRSPHAGAGGPGGAEAAAGRVCWAR